MNYTHTHTKFRLSKCSLLTRCGLHENYVMSRKSIVPELLKIQRTPFPQRNRQNRRHEMLEPFHAQTVIELNGTRPIGHVHNGAARGAPGAREK